MTPAHLAAIKADKLTELQVLIHAADQCGTPIVHVQVADLAALLGAYERAYEQGANEEAAKHADCCVDREELARALAGYEWLQEGLRDVSAFARSGWRKEGGQFYCLVCDESLCLTPGATKGKRAATFEEITHDPECPVPMVESLLPPDRQPAKEGNG